MKAAAAMDLTVPGRCKVIIAVPTFRRPGRLRRLLAALDAMERPCDIIVLVADNDAARQEGLSTAHAFATGTDMPVRTLLVAQQGLSSVRNALVAEALRDPDATHVAMIDDDEWPEPQWLAALLEMQLRTGADIVGGPVSPAFDGCVSTVISACRLFRPGTHADGPVDIVWGTNNVLIQRGCLEASRPVWFDPQYELSGGEDVDFFIRQRVAGRRFAWASRAIVQEAVPEARACIGWVLKRAFRIGNTNGRIQRHRRFRGRGAAAVTGIALAKLMLAMGLFPVRVLRPASRADACCDVAEAGGMLLGVFGYRYEEYVA